MPLTSKGAEIKAAMQREYGEEKGEKVFYASKNKGTISGVDSSLDACLSKMDACVKMFERHDSERNAEKANQELIAQQRAHKLDEKDMTDRDWEGVEKLVAEEKQEPEHKEDAWSPEAREAAAKARGQGGSGYGGGRNPQEVSANLYRNEYPNGVSAKEYKRLKEKNQK